MLLAFSTVMPFWFATTNNLAYLAQIVILCVFLSALAIEVNLGADGDNVLFGIVLIAINLSTIFLAFGTSWIQHKQKQKLAEIERTKMVTKLEWAVGFSPTKFQTTMDKVTSSAIPPNNCLAFYYGSKTEIEQVGRMSIAFLKQSKVHLKMRCVCLPPTPLVGGFLFSQCLRSGIPSREGFEDGDSPGVTFSLHLPNDLVWYEREVFAQRQVQQRVLSFLASHFVLVID